MSPLVRAFIWMDGSNFSESGNRHGTTPLNLTTGPAPVWLPNINTTAALRGRTVNTQALTTSTSQVFELVVRTFGSSHSPPPPPPSS